jgi:hypothetical protein
MNTGQHCRSMHSANICTAGKQVWWYFMLMYTVVNEEVTVILKRAILCRYIDRQIDREFYIQMITE